MELAKLLQGSCWCMWFLICVIFTTTTPEKEEVTNLGPNIFISFGLWFIIWWIIHSSFLLMFFELRHSFRLLTIIIACYRISHHLSPSLLSLFFAIIWVVILLFFFRTFFLIIAIFKFRLFILIFFWTRLSFYYDLLRFLFFFRVWAFIRILWIFLFCIRTIFLFINLNICSNLYFSFILYSFIFRLIVRIVWIIIWFIIV